MTTAYVPEETAVAPEPDGLSRRTGPLRRSRQTGGGWPLARVFAVGVVVATVATLAVIVVGAVALARLVDARAVAVQVTTPARTAGQALSVALLDQETGVRGYALSGEPAFLGPYTSGRAAEDRAVAQLRDLAAAPDLAVVGSALDEVQRRVAAWRAGYADAVLAGEAPSVDTGRELFDEVRVALGVLTGELDTAQTAVRERVDAATAAVIADAVVVALVLLGLLVAVGVGLRRGVLVPVSRLATDVRDVVSGDISRPVGSSGPREIAELGMDVEAMRAHIVRELDAVRRAHAKLDEQARDLERSNRDLEQFAYVASHDLQEPLRKVSSFCQLLQRRYAGQLDDRADQYIGFAVDGAQRMQRLINDLLAFSRVGRTVEGFAAVDLNAVAATVGVQLESARAAVDGEIVVGELPTVTGDPALLRQLLLNVVGNGLKFHREGVAPVVRLDAVRTADAWQLSVSDNGIGIEPEYADKVFVIFQRLHGRDRYPGTGIGLALAKKIVEFHGGRIGLDTPDDGPGTVVRISLPDQPQETP